MSDKREELIEEAAKAISDKSWKGFALGESFPEAYARIAFAVFEQAHTPTDDEREAARAYADAEYPELRLAPENEDRADIAERAFLAGSRFRRTAAQEPSAHDGDCEADWGSEGQESPCRCAERAQGEPTVRDHVRSLTGATDAELDELGGFQGEPSDAQVDAAYLAWNGARIEGGHTGFTAMRAALRAAYEEGKS